MIEDPGLSLGLSECHHSILQRLEKVIPSPRAVSEYLLCAGSILIRTKQQRTESQQVTYVMLPKRLHAVR